jgi:hypothetical protein
MRLKITTDENNIWTDAVNTRVVNFLIIYTVKDKSNLWYFLRDHTFDNMHIKCKFSGCYVTKIYQEDMKSPLTTIEITYHQMSFTNNMEQIIFKCEDYLRYVKQSGNSII